MLFCWQLLWNLWLLLWLLVRWVLRRKLLGNFLVWNLMNFGLNLKVLMQNCGECLVVGESSWNRLGIELLCRNGGVVQMLFSGWVLQVCSFCILIGRLKLFMVFCCFGGMLVFWQVCCLMKVVMQVRFLVEDSCERLSCCGLVLISWMFICVSLLMFQLSLCRLQWWLVMLLVVVGLVLIILVGIMCMCYLGLCLGVVYFVGCILGVWQKVQLVLNRVWFWEVCCRLMWLKRFFGQVGGFSCCRVFFRVCRLCRCMLEVQCCLFCSGWLCLLKICRCVLMLRVLLILCVIGCMVELFYCIQLNFQMFQICGQFIGVLVMWQLFGLMVLLKMLLVMCLKVLVWLGFFLVGQRWWWVLFQVVCRRVLSMVLKLVCSCDLFCLQCLLRIFLVKWLNLNGLQQVVVMFVLSVWLKVLLCRVGMVVVMECMVVLLLMCSDLFWQCSLLVWQVVQVMFRQWVLVFLLWCWLKFIGRLLGLRLLVFCCGLMRKLKWVRYLGVVKGFMEKGSLRVVNQLQCRFFIRVFWGVQQKCWWVLFCYCGKQCILFGVWQWGRLGLVMQQIIILMIVSMIMLIISRVFFMVCIRNVFVGFFWVLLC